MKKDEKVCHCFNVTVGDIAKAIEEGAKSVSDVKRATQASTACKRCSDHTEKVVSELLHKK